MRERSLKKMAHFKAFCTLTALAEIRTFMRNELGKLGLAENVMNELVLAVDEACANNIIHQHNCNEKEGFDLFVYAEPGRLIVEIQDSAPLFRIDQYNPVDIKDIITDRRQGGLGLLLIKRIMDKVEVEEKEGKAVYRFIKKV